MPFCRQRELCFIHVPKTGGCTIESLFGLRSEGFGNSFATPTGELHPLQHMTPGELLKYNIMTAQQLSVYFTFCFVRNPWDRLVSDYHNFFSQVTNDFQNYIEIVEEIVAVQNKGESYVQTWDTFPNPVRGIDNGGNGKINTHFVPQHQFIYHEGKSMIEFIGRFENFENEILELCHCIRNRGQDGDLGAAGKIIEGTTPIHKEHSSKHDHYNAYYNDYTRRVVEKSYAQDIAMFNYRF